MNTIILTEHIRAPKNRVFSTIADIQNFAKAVPDIVDIEFLSESQKGMGTRFKETRIINGKEHIEELEVTEYLENEHIRLVTDNYGTVWDSQFTVREIDDATELTLVLTAKAYKILPKLLNPIMSYFIKKAIAKDLRAVKSYCEK